jgi:long-chain fatty acid transport protein
LIDVDAERARLGKAIGKIEADIEKLGKSSATRSSSPTPSRRSSPANAKSSHNNLSCAGTYTESFGAGATYGAQAIATGRTADGTGTISEGFTSTEFGLTCGAHFNAGKGRLWILGGGFLQDFDYSQTVSVAALGNTNATLSFHDKYRPGYRIGAAYEIPEIALRAQIMYRSAVTQRPGSSEGSFVTQAVGSSTASGYGTLPQSVEMKLQSGIAPGWLAFGSVKWTDWSVLQTLNYTVDGTPLANDYQLDYYYKDGWTVTGGIGHQFNEMLSAFAAVSWDKGVGTGWDTDGDKWTVAAGLSTTSDNITLRAGAGYTFIKGVTETQYGGANAGYGDGHAVSLSASATASF